MGFQRQLCEFEKLLHLKKSYSSPNRVDKLTAKIVNGPPAASVTATHGLNTNYGTNRTQKDGGEIALKGYTRQMIQASDKRSGNMVSGVGKVNVDGLFSANTSQKNNEFFDQEVPLGKEYERVTFFDRSNALGFSEDKLGRLAEINKTQLDQALRDMNNFARTDAGFNR